jgi:hypothetical protein
LIERCLRISFFVAAESNQSISYAASLGSFVVLVIGSSGVFFFGFLLSVKKSLFFVCNTTDSNEGNDEDDDEGDNDGDDDGDKDNEKLVDNRLDTVDGVDRDINNFVEEVLFYFISRT